MKQQFNRARRHNNRSSHSVQPQQIFRYTNLDSSGPLGKLRGTALQLSEKYQAGAKDAQMQGDDVLMQTCQQYADHYLRLQAIAIENEQNLKAKTQTVPVQVAEEVVENEEKEETEVTEEIEETEDISETEVAEEIEETEEDTESETVSENEAVEKKYENWEAAYTAFLSDNANFEEWLYANHSFSEMAWEMTVITGFTIFDVDNDGTPELLINAQSTDIYMLNQLIGVYAYNDETGDVEYVMDFSSSTLLAGSIEAGGYDEEMASSFMVTVADNYNLVAGFDADGQMIVFNKIKDAMECFSVDRVINLYGASGNERLEVVYSEDYDFYNESLFTYGDREEAEKVISEYTPFMFFEINSNNISKYISENYADTDIYDYTVQEVIDFLKEKEDYYTTLDKSDIEVDGNVMDMLSLGYNIEYLMQWSLSL